MFEIIPAVDIQQGRAVRLLEGDPQKETVYFDDPVAAAAHWAQRGASWLHLVDLDSALGNGNNASIIRRVAEQVGACLELGGGIRTLEAARNWLELLDRVILGTVAISQPELLDALLADYRADRVAVAIDARGGRVAVRGWAEVTSVDACELARRAARQGVRHVIYTDIARDGTMKGIDEAPLRRMRKAFPHTLVAGGGVGGDEDLDRYQALGLDGAVVGRALYEGAVHYPRTT